MKTIKKVKTKAADKKVARPAARRAAIIALRNKYKADCAAARKARTAAIAVAKKQHKDKVKDLSTKYKAACARIRAQYAAPKKATAKKPAAKKKAAAKK